MNTIVVLSVMWDWRNQTSSVGYAEQAPRWFKINLENLTGSRLYRWLGDDWSGIVTNTCPELVSSASQKGKPSTAWLCENLGTLYERHNFDKLLVCGKVAQATYSKIAKGLPRVQVIYTPHPAARVWTTTKLDAVKNLIQRDNKRSIRIEVSPVLRVFPLML